MTRSNLFLAILLTVVTCVVQTSAQNATGPNAARPDRGVGNAGALSVSDIDNINLSNGNVNLSIPLAALPPVAGGRLSFWLNASFNSKLWNVTRHELKTPSTGYSTYLVDTPQLDDSGGWRVGGAYRVVVRDAREDVDYYTPQQAEDAQEWTRLQHRLYKVVLVTPDGAEHELRPTDYANTYGGTRDFLRGYYYDTPDTTHAPMRYYSYDGTHLYAVVEPSDSASPTRWTILLPDGTRVFQYKNGIQKIKDTNGNAIKIWSADGVQHYQDEGTGREIRYSEDWSANTGQVSYQTVGGAWVTVDINWGWTRVQGVVYDVDDWGSQAGELGGGMCRRQEQLAAADIRVIREIVLPATEPGGQRQRFTFSYDSDTTETANTQVRWACSDSLQPYARTASVGMGALTGVQTPAGAVVNYAYEYPSPLLAPHYFRDPNEIAREAVTEKRLTHDGVTDVWDYSIGEGQASVTGPDGTTSSESSYPHDPAFPRMISPDVQGKSGLVYRSARSGKTVVERHWKLMPFTGANTSSLGTVGGNVSFNPVIDAEYTSLLENGAVVKMSAKTFQFDYNGNPLQTTDYDWFDPAQVTRDDFGIPVGVPAAAQVLRVTSNAYYNGAPTPDSANIYAKRALSAPAPSILNAPRETTVGASRTQFSYDGQTYGAAPTLGNLTAVSSFDDRGDSDASNDRWLTASYTYDSYGNRSTATDANGNVSQFFYEDATHALPTRVVVDPLNGTGQQTTLASFDFSTGLLTSQTDVNGNTTTIDYINQLTGAVDPFGRAGMSVGPAVVIDGVSQHRRAYTFYEDATRRVRVEADLKAEGDRLLKSRETRDQLGRTVLSERSEGGSAYTISARTAYERMGRVTYTSNPTRGGGASTDGWTRSTRDDAGRVIEVAAFSGAAQPPAAGTNANWTGSVRTAYYANETTTTDQDERSRRTAADALGRLTRVVEAPGSLNYVTDYSYDALGNLRTVAQGAQTRNFVYGSLSRLVSATHPESGTTTYTYDGNGNLLTRTDARAKTTTYQYDGLNRQTGRTYSDFTPPVSYIYDTLPSGKGRLTSVSSSVSASAYTGYDALGRVTGSSQTTEGQTYLLSYGYDLAGNLTSQTYPSGRVVSAAFDNAGRLSSITGQQAGEGAKTYASLFSYTPHGAVAALKLGNSQPLSERWEHTLYNSRLQPVEIGLGTSPSDASLLRLNYTFGTTANNGNVRSQSISAPGLSLVQSYSYDMVNRIDSAQETNAGAETWRQAYSYLDQSGQNGQYGNRRLDTSIDPSKGSSRTTANVLPPSNPLISSATNRVAPGQGYVYDPAGNLTADPYHSYSYDAENRLLGADDGQTFGHSAYGYDGDGRRVRKVTGASVTVFVYNAAGQLVAEYTNQTPSGGGTSYLTQDTLGSTRVVTDGAGAVKSRHDYLPFGEEINAQFVSGGRGSVYGYNLGHVRQKFTGYERDDETGLDFAQARYYGANEGRFTSVDPLSASASASRPQSWNRYAYALNNPLRFIDPTGLAAADYYNEDGKRLGTDGVEDGKIYVVPDKEEAKNVQAADKNHGTTPVSEVKSAVELPSHDVRQAIGAAVERSNKPTSDDKKGGHHEEGITWGLDAAKGEKIAAAAPGPAADPQKDSHAEITLANYANKADNGTIVDVKGTAHVHPKAEVTVPTPSTNVSMGGMTTTMGGEKTTTYNFTQPPSATDKANALPGVTNIVVGARDQKVYIYNSNGVRATFPLKQFLK